MSRAEEQDVSNDIAVIGMSGRFPGAANLEAFWDNLRQGRESIRTLSDEELLRSGIDCHAIGAKNYVKAAANLDGVEFFDNSFFGFTPGDAKLMDPQVRLLLECAWTAIEHAGYNVENYSGAIGMFAGAAPNTYFMENLMSNRELMRSLAGPLSSLAVYTASDALSTMVSFKLNLRGPSITVQTACSTSLVAVHLACQSLLSYESDMALAGGVNLTIPQEQGYSYQPGMILSPDGHCRPFDASAAGTVFGGGLGLVLLKRFSDARADGDHIHAVIKGSAVNNDGSTKAGFTAPSVVGQAKAIADALAVADVPADAISYVEAHGTGTILGDPIEIEAMSQAFSRTTTRNGFCGIGSVKSNIGHLDRAAGVASLIKTILSLEHRQIPPTLHFQRPNPSIHFDQTPFHVVDKLTEWKSNGGPRRAGVNSVGFGGTNSYVVLEEAPERIPSISSRPYQLLLLSARTDAALEMATGNLAEHLENHSETTLADAAYTLQVGRQPFDVRSAQVCRDRGDAVAALKSSDKKGIFSGRRATSLPSVVFMFPGQGSQYVGMGRELYENESVFRSVVDRCFEILKPKLDLREVLFPEQDRQAWAAEQLVQTRITQPALFVIEYALAQLWLSWGIRPAAMIGHSVGEYVAACLAGVFSLEDGLRLIAERGRLVQEQPGGAMLAIRLSEEDVLSFLDKELSIASLNAPSLSVVSGPSQAVAILEEKLVGQHMVSKRLKTSHAFHSVMMDPVVAPLKELLKTVSLAGPQIPFVSNVTGRWITASETTDPTYWATHLREPVRFSEGVGELLGDSPRMLLEVGPGQTLIQMVRQHPLKGPETLVLASLSASGEGGEMKSMLEALGRAWVAGVEIDWRGFHANETLHRAPLPTYPFEKKRFWIEASRASATAVPALDPQAVLESTGGASQTSLDGPSNSATNRDDNREANLPAGATDILGLLKTTLHELSGISLADLQESATFLEMGLDSLFLAQFCRKLEDTFAVPITFTQLADELSTLRDLAVHLTQHLPPERIRRGASPIALKEVSANGPTEARLSQIVESLRGILHELSGISLAELQDSITFLEMGLDSLFLAQFSARIEERLGVSITFSQLADELATLRDLARHLDRELPPGIIPGRTESADASRRRDDDATLELLKEQIRALTLEVQKLRDTAVGIRPAIDSSVSQNAEGGAQTETITLPITAEQQEIWLASQLGDNASRAYNELVLVRLRGKLHLEALEQSIQELVARHDSLRTTFSAKGDQQYIRAARAQEVSVIDLSSIEESEREGHMQETVDRLNRTIFDLVLGPLMKVHLLRLNDRDHLLHLAFHHSIVDGWSTHVIVSELGQIYSAKISEVPCDLGAPIRSRDYIDWYYQADTIKRRAVDEAFWLQSLSDRPEAVELPTSRVRPMKRSYRAGNASIHVDGEMYRHLKKTSAKLNCTLFHFLLSTFEVWLHRITRQSDIVVGVPVAGQLSANLQHIRGCERLVGHCANLVPIRSHMRGDLLFKDSLMALKRQVLTARAHEGITYGELVDKLDLPRDPSRVPLISVSLNLNDDPHMQWNGLDVAVEVPPLSFVFFDLEINMWETSDGIRVACYFADDLFDTATVQRWLLQWQTLMTSAADRPGQRLDELAILGEAECERLLVEWNQTEHEFASPERLHELIGCQAKITPEAIAVEFEGKSLSYRELDRRSNQLARYLKRLGVGPEVLVGLFHERSLDMMVGTLGILKAGGAYVPLDPSFPEDRLGYMVENSGMRVLLTQSDLDGKLPVRPGSVVRLDADWEQIAKQPDDRINEEEGSGKDLAYVLYTSGSTGKPKGVQIEHKAIVNFLLSMQKEPGFTAQDTILAVTTLSFDIAGLELYLPLICGGRVVIASTEDAHDPARLMKRMEESQCSVMQATPATWRALIDAGWSGSAKLKILCGGESFPPDLAEKLLARCGELWNMYGPTETTVWSTIRRVTSANGAIPIGKPIANTQLYVLDEARNLVPVGIVGELYIGGQGVARGYLHWEELTKERFVESPFDRGARLYRTGDLARWLPDGSVECLGRVDNQVKIRGFRIELEEIEAILSRHEAVGQCVVVAREDMPGGKALVAYYQAAEGAQAAVSELRSYLKKDLPDYMVPSAFVFMEKLPLTPNGKIDRKALPAPGEQSIESTGEFLEPRDSLEQALANIWSRVSKVKRVGRCDNFFDLGGNSLSAVELISEVQKLTGKTLPLATLLQAGTVEAFADILRVEGYTPS